MVCGDADSPIYFAIMHFGFKKAIRFWLTYNYTIIIGGLSYYFVQKGYDN